MTKRFTWDERIERAECLKTQRDSAAELLAFDTELLLFQKSLGEELAKLGEAAIASLAVRATELLSMVERCAPPPMAALARELHSTDWDSLVRLRWCQRMEGISSEKNLTTDEPQDFFVQALLQPYAESLALGQPEWLKERCPFCNSLPQLGVMRPEGNGAKRSLYCGLCGTEWIYRRLKCVNCGEEDKELLPVFKGERYPQVLIAACDTCKTYLKCIDLSIDGHAVPPVDDIASVAVSLWAIEQQYRPVTANLFGF